MKQRIRVVSIVKDKDDILFLKQNASRKEGEVFWSLPIGKMIFGEQPEEAVARMMYDDFGLQVDKIKLVDAITFLSLDGSSQLGNLYIVYEVDLAASQKIKLNEKYSSYKYIDKDVWQGNIRVDDGSLSVLEILYGKNRVQKNNYRGAANSGATVFVDGCSRGNPGPAGIGYYIVGGNGEVLRRGGKFVGFATSRVAEYFALKEGCHQAIELGLRTVRFVNDNLMMINQMNGVYKIKNKDIMPIYEDIRQMLDSFEACAFVHVNREQNKEADQEANNAVNRHFE